MPRHNTPARPSRGKHRRTDHNTSAPSLRSSLSQAYPPDFPRHILNDKANDTIHLDGRTLEGGGQLLRVALSLSALSGKAVYVHHVRGQGRGAGGLKGSHVVAVEVLRGWCGARVWGARRGSGEVVFVPVPRDVPVPVRKGQGTREGQKEKEREIDVDLGTPGAVGLVLQCLYPYLLFRPPQKSTAKSESKSSTGAAAGLEHGIEKLALNPDNPEDNHNYDYDYDYDYTLTIHGGTHVSKSMSTSYISQVLLPTLRKLNFPPITMSQRRRGWSTGGGPKPLGEVTFHLDALRAGASLPPLCIPTANLKAAGRGAIVAVDVTVLASDEGGLRGILTDTICGEVAATDFNSKASAAAAVELRIVDSEDSGALGRLYVLLVAHTSEGWRLGRDYLHEGKVRPPRREGDLDVLIEGVSKVVVRDLMREVKSGGCVDEYLQDQLVVFQALAAGRSVVYGGGGGGVVEDQQGKAGTDEEADVVEKGKMKQDDGDNNGDGDDGEDDHQQDAIGEDSEERQQEPPEDQISDAAGSLHTKTVRWVVKKLSPDVKFEPGGICHGIGLSAS